MLKDEWPTFVAVTLNTLLLFETAEQAARNRLVRIVAVDTLENAFAQTMALIEIEQGQRFLMAADTQLARVTKLIEQGRDRAHFA